MKLFGKPIRIELIVIMGLIIYVMSGFMVCSCSRVTAKEGFALLSGSSLEDPVMGAEVRNSATNPAPRDAGRTHADNIGRPVPPPEGTLDMLNGQEFSPDCCSSPYSSSGGCACFSKDQVDFLNHRGGNRD